MESIQEMWDNQIALLRKKSAALNAQFEESRYWWRMTRDLEGLVPVAVKTK